jgi:prepilin peptidase CpaA
MGNVWFITLWKDGGLALPWGAALAVSLAAAVTDLRCRRIPNWLTMPAFVGGLVHAAWVGSWAGLADGLAASLIVALPFLLLFLLAGGGAGDAKLMGALGAWTGLVAGIVVLGCVALMGVVQGVVVWLARRHAAGRPAGLIGRIAGACTVRQGSGTETVIMVPYGVAIFLGVFLSALGVLSCRA